ncbi:MAG: SIS domain-containing protein [Parachlamydia sp.]|nr:SIS domain-containing protein [Parachlamydia sp.]
MINKFIQSINESLLAKEQLKEPRALRFLEGVSQLLSHCFRQGGKVLIAGNGGSLCDASHFAEELTGYFRKPRKALPAIPLTEAGHLTCVGNDQGFEWVFARGIEAHGVPGDVFIGLTTSGNSPNIVKAFEQAKLQGLHTVAFLGKGGGELKGQADFELLIEGFETSDRIQEAHMTAMHLLIEGIEELLFYSEANCCLENECARN